MAVPEKLFALMEQQDLTDPNSPVKTEPRLGGRRETRVVELSDGTEVSTYTRSDGKPMVGVTLGGLNNGVFVGTGRNIEYYTGNGLLGVRDALRTVRTALARLKQPKQG